MEIFEANNSGISRTKAEYIECQFIGSTSMEAELVKIGNHLHIG